MTALWRLAITRAWLVLVLATVVVFTVAENDAAARSATVAIMLIAAGKLRLVFLYFMELTRDAMPWRLFAEIWMLVVTSVILGIYLLTPQ